MKKYFRDLSNFFSFALGLVPSLIFYIFKPTESVPLWVLLAIIFLLCLSVWINIKLYMDMKELTVTDCIQIIECSHGLCLCKSNNLITHFSLVMFYESSGDYEKVLGFGIVESINPKGVAQINVHSLENNNFDILEYINNKKSNISVRPTVTWDVLQKINATM